MIIPATAMAPDRYAGLMGGDEGFPVLIETEIRAIGSPA